MLSKFRLFFVESCCGPIVAFNLFTSIIVFISTSIQLKFLGGNSFANILWGRPSINSLGIDLTVSDALLLAIISIVLLTLSRLLRFNSSLADALADAFGTLGGIIGLMGILHIMLSGILNTTPLFYTYDIHQIFRFAFLRTLEYSFLSALYLGSIVGAWNTFFISENENE